MDGDGEWEIDGGGERAVGQAELGFQVFQLSYLIMLFNRDW